jgi:hypothetical protein
VKLSSWPFRGLVSRFNDLQPIVLGSGHVTANGRHRLPSAKIGDSTILGFGSIMSRSCLRINVDILGFLADQQCE